MIRNVAGPNLNRPDTVVCGYGREPVTVQVDNLLQLSRAVDNVRSHVFRPGDETWRIS